ncbi:type VI secretion system baseplate subunit TssF [Paraburkholderia bannensis]|uniref:type VI secretion system baseplate subunit TssF n=1 Tax=Paraburkholderia bannensis TaxID=765414 RepID=UPI0004830B75|nr:type VI secretion system baseplate subunit TssF [Paraburkholderia bannensis]
MDSRLLDYYTAELGRLREHAAGFARQHPAIAARLGAPEPETVDPYVEFLIDAFCQMAARMRVKLDTEFPRFAARLLESFYPGYLAPTPSISVARVYPRQAGNHYPAGYSLPRGTMFTSRVARDEKTACQFRSAQDVVLYPLEISDVRLTGIPADITGLERYVAPQRYVRGAMRMRLRTTDGTNIADLPGLERLPIYLCGDEPIASHLFELLHAASVGTVIGEPAGSGATGQAGGVAGGSIAHEGLGIGQGLLPLTWSKFHGHNLLREYFACPSRFYFFTLTGLADGFRRVHAREVEIVVLLDQPTDRLASRVDASRMALFCTPVVNLFRRRTDQFEISPGGTDTLLASSRLDPLDYEVFAIERVTAQQTPTSTGVEFRPMFETLNRDKGNYGRHFALRREQRCASDAARQSGTRTAYIGTETFVSLVDQHDAPWNGTLRYLSADAWVTNRDLPMLVPRDGVDDLDVDLEGAQEAIRSVGLVRPPSLPRQPDAGQRIAWQLIRHLNFNYVPIRNMDHRVGGRNIRDLLRLFLGRGDIRGQRQVEGLIGVETRATELMLEDSRPLMFGRSVATVLTVDETGFSGTSPWLLGLMLEHFLAHHSSTSAYSQTELHSMQRGMIARWPARVAPSGHA